MIEVDPRDFWEEIGYFELSSSIIIQLSRKIDTVRSVGPWSVVLVLAKEHMTCSRTGI